MPDLPFNEMTDEALLAEYRTWDHKIREATSWGAALAAADSFRRSARRVLERRGVPIPDEP